MRLVGVVMGLKVVSRGECPAYVCPICIKAFGSGNGLLMHLVNSGGKHQEIESKAEAFEEVYDARDQ